MSNLLATLEQHRDLILLAEIGAALHDIGKLSSGFIIDKLVEADRPKKHQENLHPDGVLQEDEDRLQQDEPAIWAIQHGVRQSLIDVLSGSVGTTAATLIGSISLADFITRHHPKPVFRTLQMTN